MHEVYELELQNGILIMPNICTCYTSCGDSLLWALSIVHVNCLEFCIKLHYRNIVLNHIVECRCSWQCQMEEMINNINGNCLSFTQELTTVVFWVGRYMQEQNLMSRRSSITWQKDWWRHCWMSSQRTRQRFWSYSMFKDTASWCLRCVWPFLYYSSYSQGFWTPYLLLAHQTMPIGLTMHVRSTVYSVLASLFWLFFYKY